MKALPLRALSAMGKCLRRTPLAQSSILNKAHEALTAWLRSPEPEARVGEFLVRFDEADRFISKKLVLYGGYEQLEIDLLCSLLKPGDVVADVGANIGLYSLHLSRAVGPDGRVIAFEPDPQNAEILRHNLKTNHCHNVTVVECALGETNGTAKLFQVAHDRGYLSFADLGQTGSSIEVPVRRAEEVYAELGVRPRAAKIDVEGAEPQVLAGMGEYPEILVFEFVPEQLRALKHDPTGFLDSLLKAGYELQIIDPDDGSLMSTPPQEMTEFTDPKAANYNILGRRSV